MPIVKGLGERVAKFTAKTAPDRVGTRYDAVKSIAIKRFTEFGSGVAEFRELVRNAIESAGVPAGKQGVYYAFALKARKAVFSHTGDTLMAYINGLIADFTTGKGADPRVLRKIAAMILGEVVS